uniref:2EXR domain-containing protein n=1 Tax=Bionectria ochroleuca TaxID=29856 RepID=A0A0B7K8V7_BIOOC
MLPITSLSADKPTAAPDSVETRPVSKFKLLPPEIRLKIWSCAIEPRVILLADLAQKPCSYPLPGVTQLNTEARDVSRRGYEPVGNGSFVQFSKDMLLCDHVFTEQRSNPLLETIAPRIERAIFWDCIPDERVRRPADYSTYLSTFYGENRTGHICFDKLWFPNLREYWFIKVGEVDKEWMISSDRTASFDTRTQQMAREFNYWVNDNIVEMAHLDMRDSGAQTVLREGRCSLDNCRSLNRGRNHIMSKVNFKDGNYQAPDDGRSWVRISSAIDGSQLASSTAASSRRIVNHTRWALVERSLTFMLRHDWPSSQHRPRIKRDHRS